MPHEQQNLRLRAREAINRQLLPDRKPDHTWGGPGSGAPCPICGDTLAADEMVFDLEFSAEAGQRAPTNHQVHVRCFRVWEQELESLRSGTKRATLPDSERNQSNNQQQR